MYDKACDGDAQNNFFTSFFSGLGKQVTKYILDIIFHILRFLDLRLGYFKILKIYSKHLIKIT